MNNKNIKVFLATSSFGLISKKAIDILKSENIEIIKNPYSRKLNSNEIIENAKDVDGIIAGTEQYSKQVVENLNNLKVISRLGVGIDNIDIKITKKIGIKVFKTSTTPALAVSELVLGLMINLYRGINNNHQLVVSNKWQKNMGNLLNGKTLGIIGLGIIGKTLVKISKGFNFKILAFDKKQNSSYSMKNNIKYCSLNHLLKESDLISIHLNLNKDTNQMINYEKLNFLKKNAVLINTSRGEIVDEEALYRILKSKKIAGAGLDVFNTEPYYGKFTKLDNVLLSPHIGSYAEEIRVAMELESANNLIKGLYNE